MKTFVLFLLLGLVAVGGLLFQQNQYETNLDNQKSFYEEKLETQTTSLNDYLAFKGYKMEIYKDGLGGVFDGDRNMLYVKTNYGSKKSCLFFLHELGHSIQKQNNDVCFYSKDLLACEQGAKEYAKENEWRCDGL